MVPIKKLTDTREMGRMFNMHVVLCRGCNEEACSSYLTGPVKN